MENAYLIKGGKPLRGEVRLSGAKNVALKIIIASLLFDQEVIVDNVPRITDVFELLHLIKKLGGRADFVGKNIVRIDGRTINKNKIDLLHASKIRVSFMFFAPLLRKFRECYIPNPGGCRIGARPIDRIILGMKSLGVDIEYDSATGYYQAKLVDKISGYYCFPKPSHTGTELLILLSIFNDDMVVIDNSALEPEIDELITFLNLAGGRINRHGKKIIIMPSKQLVISKPFTITSDRNEAVTYASLLLSSKGEGMIYPILPSSIEIFINKVREIGGGVEQVSDDKLKFFWKGSFLPSTIETLPHPGFMTDWQPNWAVIMTQAQGESVIIERVFENRFSYVEELKKLGAKIEYLDLKKPPDYFFFNYEKEKRYFQAIKISGPVKLHGGVLNILDLRAGASLTVAALIAEGESIINNISILQRGYENFIEKVVNLGGEIKMV